MSEDDWVPLRRFARDVGIDRQALLRWLKDGKLRGRQGANRYWEVDPSSLPPDLMAEYRRHRAASAAGLNGAGVDLAAELADQRKLISELLASNREKDRVIAKLLDRLQS